MQRNASERREAMEPVQQYPLAFDDTAIRCALNVTTCVFAEAVGLANAGAATKIIAVAAAAKAAVLIRRRFIYTGRYILALVLLRHDERID
jgi:hypothetical protein